MRHFRTKKAEATPADTGWSAPLTFPFIAPHGKRAVFQLRLPVNMELTGVNQLGAEALRSAAPAAGASVIGAGRVALDVAPVAEQAFLMGSVTPIVCGAISAVLREGAEPDVLATVSVALTDVTSPPYTAADDEDSKTTVKALDERLVWINRLCLVPYGSPPERVPVSTDQFRWLSPWGAAMTFSTTRKGMFGPEGHKFLIKVARAAYLGDRAPR